MKTERHTERNRKKKHERIIIKVNGRECMRCWNFNIKREHIVHMYLSALIGTEISIFNRNAAQCVFFSFALARSPFQLNFLSSFSFILLLTSHVTHGMLFFRLLLCAAGCFNSFCCRNKNRRTSRH